MNRLKWTVCLMMCTSALTAQQPLPVNAVTLQERIVVDPSAKGDFKTIREALNSLPDSSDQDRVIFIKTGVYNEHVVVTKHHVVIEGESKENTIITGSIASLIYSCEHPGDRNSAVLNIESNDVTIRNITIENTYGLHAPDHVFIDCKNGTTGQPEKIEVGKTAHQFALRTSIATRLKVINCIVRSWGQDTVAPWNGRSGMYYFKDCTIIGGTDFFCPRGWSYAEHCTFITNVANAVAIWHDGSKGKNMKSVFRDCKFTGEVPYKLGRYHHEANFYLLDCWFDGNMANAPIFKAASAKPMSWDSQAYYYNCSMEGKKFDWLKDNLDTAPGSPAPDNITALWTFERMWDPSKIF